jgi:hypothetical protein
MANRTYKYKSRVVANWDRIPKVEGRVIAKDSVKIENRVRPFMMVLTSDGEVQVFESAGLVDLFKSAELGDFVSIEFLATVETSKGRAFRQFRSMVWTDDDAEPMESVNPTGKRRRGRPPVAASK